MTTAVDAYGPSARPETETIETTRTRSRAARLLVGDRDAAWARPGLLSLLGATAVLYLWGLGASGWANSFYSAAVQAGTHSWKAAFFGSLDAANSITVDKPPAALWVMDASARIFGLNSWSILVPEALMGVAAVGVLYATVRRAFGPAAGLLAGAVLALTPVATLMFRFNNPDALLVLLLVGAAYTFVRALQSTRTGWLLACAGLVGTAFITKMLQALLVVPVFGAVYLVTANTPLRRRILQLLGAGIALVVASGWWVAAVQLTPAADRPYIGGSQNNSLLNLIFGYNGFGRITGNETGSVGGSPRGGTGMWGPTGITRLFTSDFGGQIAWLIPTALILLVAMLWFSRRAPRIDQRRAQVLMWGGWLVVTGLTFSYAAGIIHPYYTVALAPPIAAIVGIGATFLWSRRDYLAARLVLAAGVAAATWSAWVLLDRTPAWHPGLRSLIAVAGVVTCVAILLQPQATRATRANALVAAVALFAGLAGPTAYSLATAATPHSGSIPSAGPSGASGFGPGGGGPGRLRGGAPGGLGGFGAPPGTGTTGGANPFGGFAGPFGQTNGGAPSTGTLPGLPGAGGTTAGGTTGGGTTGAAPQGGGGGLLNASTPSAALLAALKADDTRYTWVAATVGANNAAGYQLASDRPVMAIGGFNGTDPSPSLAQFEAWVAAKRIHYFIASGVMGTGRQGAGGPGGMGGSGSAEQITTWVEDHFTATTIGGVTVYDLSSGL
jgi:4-amino-4-deoxy-L-arabinose transferase-like glycosyltransferase